MMSIIKILDSFVVNFIAAGEIIENLSSIVKELLENSIDSGASVITLGLSNHNDNPHIVIEDNGCGIDPNDLPLMFLEHATSKSTDILSIININTLGFRGEALWSIGNIAAVEVITNYNNQKYSIECNYGVIGSLKNLGNSNDIGTTIHVDKIFDNIPVRKKFLKTWDEEYKLMVEVLKQEAFVYYNKTFILKKNNEIIATYNNTNPLGRMDHLYKLWNPTIVHEYQENSYKAMVLISTNNKGKFFIAINNRIIDDYKIKNYLKNMVEKYGNSLVTNFSGGIYLSLPQEDVDINIHPRKKEAKFKDSYTLYNMLKNLMDDYFSITPGNPSSVNEPIMHNQDNYYKPSASILSVHDSLITMENNHKNIHFFDHNFLIIKKFKQIIIINKNQLFTKQSHNFESKIITLPEDLLKEPIQWHQYNIKFSIVSPISIIAWSIPHNYSLNIEDFFQQVIDQWHKKNLIHWLEQFNGWTDDKIIEYVMAYKIDEHWPLNYCSWIIDESSN